MRAPSAVLPGGEAAEATCAVYKSRTVIHIVVASSLVLVVVCRRCRAINRQHTSFRAGCPRDALQTRSEWRTRGVASAAAPVSCRRSKTTRHVRAAIHRPGRARPTTAPLFLLPSTMMCIDITKLHASHDM